jgi:hypothetical protein
MDILAKHQFVRVRLGEGSGLDRKQTADALERLLDCVCVHQIGFTITLWRQAGLPRPSNCPVPQHSSDTNDVSAISEAATAAYDAAVVAAASGEQAGATKATSNSKAGRGKQGKRRRAGNTGKPGQQRQAGMPPEFQVVV